MFNSVVNYDPMMLKFVPDSLTPKKTINKAIEHDHIMLKLIPDHFKTHRDVQKSC